MPIRPSARLAAFFALGLILSLPALAAAPLSELARKLAGDLASVFDQVLA